MQFCVLHHDSVTSRVIISVGVRHATSLTRSAVARLEIRMWLGLLRLLLRVNTLRTIKRLPEMP